MRNLTRNGMPVVKDLYRELASGVLIISLITLLLVQPTFAQQPTTSFEQLKKQISLLESVHDDPAVSSDVKAVNQTLLTERRLQLQELLKVGLQSMKEYYSKVESALSEKERLSIEALIASQERDLSSLKTKLGATKPDNALVSRNFLASSNPAFVSTGGLQNAPIETTRTVDKSVPTNPNISTKAAPTNQAVVTPGQAGCYPNPHSALLTAVNQAARNIVDNNRSDEVGDFAQEIVFFAAVDALAVDSNLVAKAKKDFEKNVNILRLSKQTEETNKQIGSTSRSEGTTSAIEKPGFAELLGFAVENGAISKAVNGTTLTLSTSPYAFIVATQDDTATMYKRNGYLSRLGISATFNIDNKDNILANASRKQLSEWNLRLRLSGDRSNRSEEAEAIWNRDVAAVFAGPANALTGAHNALFRTPELEAKRQAAVTKLSTIPAVDAARTDGTLSRDQKITQVATSILCTVKSEIVDKIISGEFGLSSDSQVKIIAQRQQDFNDLTVKQANAITAFESKLTALTFKPAWTLAYTNRREAETSDYSTLKVLFEKKIEKKLNWTANSGFSMYHKPNAMLNQKQYRDFALAFSFEGLIGERSPFLSDPDDKSQVTFAFTGSYQRLFENKGVAGKKADIGGGQFKLVVPVFTGLSIPFSVTYSNATAESRKAGVRANFGITLDTDKVFQVLKIKKERAK